jgi:hypothetical protein
MQLDAGRRRLRLPRRRGWTIVEDLIHLNGEETRAVSLRSDGA